MITKCADLLTLSVSVAEEPKSASKQKKKRDAKKANKAAEENVEEAAPKVAPAPTSYLPKGIKEEQLQSDDPEKAKKIKNLKKVKILFGKQCFRW
jgi:hypothetical protein